MLVTLFVAWLAACTLVMALYLVREHSRARLRERALAVLHQYIPPLEREPGPLAQRIQPLVDSVKGRLWQAGLQPAQWQLVTLVLALVVMILIGISALGWLGGFMGMLMVLGLAHGALLLQAERRRRRMIDQLPSYVDQLMRMVNVGSTLEEALVGATREAPLPLRSVFEPVVRQTRLGGSVDEALETAAERYNLQELRLLTTAVRISRRYGSSIREMLQSIVTMVREQERARRELRGMTAETRASAWILGAMPLLLVAYMLVVNTEFFMALWAHETGRVMVFVAVALQVAGVVTLWRLLKAV